jgi:hypothetical protein
VIVDDTDVALVKFAAMELHDGYPKTARQLSDLATRLGEQIEGRHPMSVLVEELERSRDNAEAMADRDPLRRDYWVGVVEGLNSAIREVLKRHVNTLTTIRKKECNE